MDRDATRWNLITDPQTLLHKSTVPAAVQRSMGVTTLAAIGMVGVPRRYVQKATAGAPSMGCAVIAMRDVIAAALRAYATN